MECNVIQDLLPLYIDDCCTEESRRLVKSHMDGCTKCRDAYHTMRTTLAEKETVKAPHMKMQKISTWKASLVQSLVMFFSFALVAFGVTLEGATPAGAQNGLWAIALIIPATANLLSLINWYFIRDYRSRKTFSDCSAILTFGLILAGFGWAYVHYSGDILWFSPLAIFGVIFSAVLVLMSKVLSNRYALLLGR